MISSGQTAITTSTDAPVAALVVPAATQARSVCVINNGTVDGFFSLDGGTNYHFLPNKTSFTVSFDYFYVGTITVKRITGGSNLSGIYVSAKTVGE